MKKIFINIFFSRASKTYSFGSSALLSRYFTKVGLIRKLVLIGTVLSVTSCNIINPPEEIPAFLKINEFELTTFGIQGSNSHKITDGWVYVNGELLGAFPLPATVPVIWEGDAELIVDPGIKDNGIESLPDIYPFYQRYMQTVSLTSGETLEVNPRTSYKENITFAMVEEFDGGFHNIREDIDEDPNTSLEITTSDVFEGQGAGQIILTEVDATAIVASSVKFNSFPTDGRSEIYLELNYKSDTNIDIGLIGTDSNSLSATNFSRGLNARAEWNKAYINLTVPVSQSQFDLYQIVFRVSFPTSDFNKDTAVILLDNIKVIHR